MAQFSKLNKTSMSTIYVYRVLGPHHNRHSSTNGEAGKRTHTDASFRMKYCESRGSHRSSTAPLAGRQASWDSHQLSGFTPTLGIHTKACERLWDSHHCRDSHRLSGFTPTLGIHTEARDSHRGGVHTAEPHICTIVKDTAALSVIVCTIWSRGPWKQPK